MEAPKVLDEHRWLLQFVGEWKIDGDDGVGTETVTAIGENWITGKMVWTGSEMGDMESIVTVGFDDAKGRFVGSWAGTMINMMWFYDGYLEGNRLVLESEGPNFDGTPGTSLYRDIMILDDENHRRLVGEIQGKDGNWTQFMETKFVRV